MAGIVGLIVAEEDVEDVDEDALEVVGIDVVVGVGVDAVVVVVVVFSKVGLALEGEGRFAGLSGASLAMAKTTTLQKPLMVNLSKWLPSFWR